MSSSCPPQLQLTLQPNTTSFKRSFQQFGFDFPSPVEGSDGSTTDGNDRNKRARSETSFSDSTDSSQSSMVASASSSSLSPPTTGSIRTAGLSSDMSFGPPRLSTPDIEDIQMPDYPNDERSSNLSFSSSQNDAGYRLSLGSFTSLQDEDAVQRSRPSSPGAARAPTPPPVLPPLTISEGPPRLSIPSTAVSFMETQPASPLAEAFFGGESPSLQSSTEDSDLMQGFRARLSGALERLVPQSPLVPGLELDDHDDQVPSLNSNRHLLQESTPVEVPPEPPTLPPIPSVSTTAEHINIDTLLGEGSADSLSSTAVPSTSRPSVSPSLDAHPLPSPILRDLRTWMHGQERQMSVGFANPTSRHWQLYDPTAPPVFSRPSSRQRPSEEVNRVPGNSDRPHDNRPAPELLTHSPQETGLWERRSFELGNPSHDETTYSDNSSRQSISGISSSPDLSWVDHPPRLQFAFRRRPRLGSTISLVTENSLEARRIADHDHIVRDLHAGRGPRMDDIDMDVPRNDSMESSRDDILSRLDPGRLRAPYVHLPPFPTSSLDITPDAREEEEYRHEHDSGRGPMWYYATSGPGNYQGAEWQEPVARSLPESPDTEPGPHSSFTFSRYSPQHRSSSPMRPSPPVAVVPLSGSFTRLPQNHRAPVGDAYNRRPHINLTRHLALNQRREPPPLLPQPDLGHAFVTEGQDRDVEMGQAPGQPHGEYHPHSETILPSTIPYLQPRTYREEITPPYFWDSHPPEFRQPPTLLGDSPPAPVSRLQRQVPLAPTPLEIPGRPRPQPADNRRVLRFALPQSEEAGRFSTSSPTARLPERMAPVVSTISTDDRMENQGFSGMQPSHRTSEPRYLSGPAIVENVDRRRDTLPAYSPTTLDPAAFAPGPFRNTIHHSFFPRMNRPTPPTIPPLPFQEPPPSSHFQNNNNTVPIPSPEESFPPRGPFSRDESAEFNYSVRIRRPPQNAELRPPRPLFAPPRAFALNRNNDDENSTGNRRRMPLHNSSQEARLEASRLADLLSLEPSHNPSSHGVHSLPPRSDPSRLTAERQQFINFLQRHTEGERRRGSDVTHTEGPQGNDSRPASNLPPRRSGVIDLDWRTRARGRFRITPEFLTAARIRPGNMGDFIHDDDFDDSYENLVNLAVTIGDVKPKSTPTDVLEKLEKGVYREWKTADGDRRCPICLDDYTDHDTLLKLNNCDHWFHQNCLKQWLHTANTCPVCRNAVHNSEPLPTSPRRPGRRFGFWRGGPPPPPSGGAGEEGPSSRPRNNGNTGASNRWSAPLRRRFD